MLLDWLAGFVAVCRTELGWAPAVVDVGGGLGIRYTETSRRPRSPTGRRPRGAAGARLRAHGLPRPELILEPGRSLVGEAGVTLYTVGVVKQPAEGPPWVAVDGGISDNPRPLSTAPATTPCSPTAPASQRSRYTVCGKHCESGDVLIRRVALPEPRRGDLLAVPATGAYTLAWPRTTTA